MVLVMKWIKQHWLSVIAILLLAGAIVPVSYFAYYQLMNWVVVLASIVIALRADQPGKEWLMWTFIFVAIIFNPIAPFHFRADIWQIADLFAILLFLLSLFFTKKM